MNLCSLTTHKICNLFDEQKLIPNNLEENNLQEVLEKEKSKTPSWNILQIYKLNISIFMSRHRCGKAANICTAVIYQLQVDKKHKITRLAMIGFTFPITATSFWTFSMSNPITPDESWSARNLWCLINNQITAWGQSMQGSQLVKRVCFKIMTIKI